MAQIGVRLFERFLNAIANGGISPFIQKFIWKFWYQIITLGWRDREWCFMNYGYVPEPGAAQLKLEERDEKDRCFIGLYHHVTQGLPVKGQRVLEIGSGRGGGSAFIARYLRPAEITGVDFAPTLVAFSSHVHSASGNLKFIRGDAENLAFGDNTFDVVVNIESSHCYADMPRFVAEVVRVLKPGGFFAWADMRATTMPANTDQAFSHPGLIPVRAEDISAGVVRALDAVHDRKVKLVEKYRLFAPLLREFSGTRGSILYHGLKTGKVAYLVKTFRKRSA